LLSVKDDLDLDKLEDSEQELLVKRALLLEAGDRLDSARRFTRTDPLLALASALPLLGDQARGLKTLVTAADESVRTGLAATEVALAFARYERDPGRTSIEEALSFLRGQERQMAVVNEGLLRLRAAREALPDTLVGPLDSARDDLDIALTRLEGLVEGYNRANTLLPELLGYNGTRRYLLLPQNDTELFPSGGLISSYGIVTFDGGRLAGMELEYFGTLFDRWQQSTHEYIEPPAPLKRYLKYDYSWGLGEAGWYPHFPRTAELAREFVAKGGAPQTDGTIAIDLKFTKGLLQVLGPVSVPDYDLTVTAETLEEVTLEMTRDDAYVPGTASVAGRAPKKAFLSYLARSLFNRVFAAPKDQWLDLLHFLDRMARERHLQLHFTDERLQSLGQEYGLDGGLVESAGDFLLIADTSVNSTKLNLILETRATLDLELTAEGKARTRLTYEIENPFPEWRQGRDPHLVRQLMLGGVYGCYLRVYAPEKAKLVDLRLDGRTAGPEQMAVEMGKSVFGRFFPVLPGDRTGAEFSYETPGVVVQEDGGLYRYRLYVQKEAGTDALPLDVKLTLPDGAVLQEARLDGRVLPNGLEFSTDVREDREIEVVFKPG
jgi:hypothetical protein